MGPNWQQQRQQQLQRQQQQRQQQLLREQMERMSKQQASWREQQQKGYAWQQQQKKIQPIYDSSKIGKNKGKSNSPQFQLNQNPAKMPVKTQEKKGGCAQVVGLVVTLAFIALAIYGVLWLLSTF